MKILQLLFISLFLYTGQLIAQCPSTASFTYNISGYEVTVTNTSHLDQPLTNQVRFHWEFPEGSSSNQQFTNDTSTQVKHTYSSPGSYVISMLMGDSLNSCSDTATAQITIVDTCKAGFDYKVNGLSVYLTDQSTTPYSFYFIGSMNDSLMNEQVHTFDSAGTYILCQYAADNNGCSDTYCDTIVVPNNNCNASFSQIADSTQMFTIQILNNSSNASTHSYFWDFGDDSTSTARNPTHEYQAFGSYVLCLTITDSALNCISTFCDTIGMDSNGVLFKGSFTLEVKEVLVGLDENGQSISFNLFPNPTTDQLNITSSELNTGISEIRVLDLQGKEIMHKNINLNDGHCIIELEHIPSGVYFLKMQSAEKEIIKKFIKQ